MKMQSLLAMVLCAVILVLPVTGQQKQIIGYYPSWRWRDTTALMTPEKIPYKKLTMINYAFWFPRTDGSIVGRDSAGDALILRETRGRPSIIELSHRNGVKIILSVGGWEDSGNFPAVASTDSLREKFAHSCLQALLDYGFDGIDIDWEFPGMAEHNGTASDAHNYTLLVKTLRDSLVAFGKESGKVYVLSAALPASMEELKNFEIEEVSRILDQLNVMTYDYNGSWGALSGHNAPLYASNATDTLQNVDASFKLYTERFHIPSSKINLGIPFYGHSYARCTSLGAPHKGNDTTLFPHGGVMYYEVAKYAKERRWDELAKVPTLVVPGTNTLVSYDDEESVALKAQYVLRSNAHGVIIWELTGDCLANGTTPLLDAIYSTFLSSPGLK